LTLLDFILLVGDLTNVGLIAEGRREIVIEAILAAAVEAAAAVVPVQLPAGNPLPSALLSEKQTLPIVPVVPC
jgi:hypothetical protein